MNENYGQLYLIATPIGNLKDISLRALEILFEVDILLCEDTRVTGILLTKFENYNSKKNHPRLISYHDHNEERLNPQILAYLKEGKKIGICSDAGTPLISDPGYKLVRSCLEFGIKVNIIPGPCSVISGLTISGFPPDKFLFINYLPRKSGQRKNLFQKLKEQSFKHLTIVAFESPHRIISSLEDFQSVYGEKAEISICREMTKIHEEVKKDDIQNVLKYYQKNQVKGELVLVFEVS